MDKMNIFFYNRAIKSGCWHGRPPQCEALNEKEKTIMINCISRRSFLKAAGILGAAGALAACGGSSASTSTAASTAGSTAASAAASSTSIKLWTYPIGGWGNDETVQNLISSFNAKYPDIKVTVEYLDYTNGDDQVLTALEGASAPDLI